MRVTWAGAGRGGAGRTAVFWSSMRTGSGGSSGGRGRGREDREPLREAFGCETCATGGGGAGSSTGGGGTGFGGPDGSVSSTPSSSVIGRGGGALRGGREGGGGGCGRSTGVRVGSSPAANASGAGSPFGVGVCSPVGKGDPAAAASFSRCANSRSAAASSFMLIGRVGLSPGSTRSGDDGGPSFERTMISARSSAGAPVGAGAWARVRSPASRLAVSDAGRGGGALRGGRDFGGSGAGGLRASPSSTRGAGRVDGSESRGGGRRMGVSPSRRSSSGKVPFMNAATSSRVTGFCWLSSKKRVRSAARSAACW